MSFYKNIKHKCKGKGRHVSIILVLIYNIKYYFINNNFLLIIFEFTFNTYMYIPEATSIP